MPIRNHLLKHVPFGKLYARPVAASVLGFYGDSYEVFFLLQKTSHSTRAYYFNAGGLKGFLVPGPIAILSKLKKSGELEKVTRYQHVDFEAVLLKLDKEMKNE